MTAVAVPMRNGCPAKEPSPKKSPGPSMATTASLPDEDSTESFTPALLDIEHAVRLCPWAKTTAPVASRMVRGDILADLRNAWTSKAGSVGPAGNGFWRHVQPIIPQSSGLLRRIAIAGASWTWCRCAERDSREPPDLGRSSESRRDCLPPQDHVVHHCGSHRRRWRADHPQGARCRARQPSQSRVDERAMARRIPRVASIIATARAQSCRTTLKSALSTVSCRT